MRTLPHLLALTLAGPQLILADVLELQDGGKLSGSILSISPDGVITADLEISDSPVGIHADKVKDVSFLKPSRKFDHDTMLTLINGDRLPCDIVSISDTQLAVTTDYAGDLAIPRKIVATAQLGIRPRKTIYSGPENLVNWNIEDNWHFEDGSMVSDGRGSIARNFPTLPDSFSLSFRLKWADKPMLKVFFASDTPASSGGKHDRYFLQIGTAGMEIKRQSSGRNPYHSLITVNRNHDSFAEREARFEIRVDNRQRRLLLYIDGQLEGQAADPLPVIPDGKIVILHSDSSEAEAHRVSDIILREWDASGERHRSEDRGDFGEDALINNKGERYGGRIISSKTDHRGKLSILFKTPFAEDTSTIPTAEISTLFFAEIENATENSATPLIIGLAGAGTLGAHACTFGPDHVHLTHPLLGDMKLSRDAVNQLQRREIPAADSAPETEPDTEE
ncbi:hypothetical protein ACFQY0_16505 [Haloferula chungangensis]|uniref:LamG domain-containing protein n=1 Tax=Haloferula chungangensis TaxID=1048331 RepID=A0ABW2LAH5_9BACT